VLEPLRTEREVTELLGPELWREFFEQPIGKTIENTFESDLVRGVVMTDALIGTFASNHDAALDANICFLYHVIGNETGEWNIPIGGMGEVSEGLRRAALDAGATLLADCEVAHIATDGTVSYVSHSPGFADEVLETEEIRGRFVLANVSPTELEKLTGIKNIVPAATKADGAQVKVNLLLKRRPKLKDESLDPVAAFGGTFHINESYAQLQTAYEQASKGEIPSPLPCEIYCHSLTDPTILSKELQDQGAQTLTVFALHTPHSLLQGKNNTEMRERLTRAVLDSLNSVLAEPIEDLLMLDENGKPCFEAKTTQDLQDVLRLPGGNIFHGALAWPFVEDRDDLSTPAKRWGVATTQENLLICGSGARRGGAVSGIAGHNAAQAILEIIS
jgi:phytoene dehydrogenase-like protein